MACLLGGCVGLAEPARFADDGPGAASMDAGADGGPPAGRDAGGTDSGVDSGVDAGEADAGSSQACPQGCQANAACHSGVCVCNPGFELNGNNCVAPMPGTPAARTRAEVCSAFARAQMSRANGDGFSVSSATCDPGRLSRDALDDALARLNFFRWLCGLGPTTDDDSDNAVAQKCALISAWNPAGQGAHFPEPSAKCYSAEGAAGAGSSNIAWGSGDATYAMDLWMKDTGNETTFGHRRWLLNPPLGPVGIGHYSGGNNYGSAECIRVFGSSGGGGVTPPPVVSFPPPGFSPAAYAQWVWTVHGALPSNPTVKVTRASDGASLQTNYEVLSSGYGQPAAKLERVGWMPTVGETYHVVLTGTGGATDTVTWDVRPVDCP